MVLVRRGPLFFLISIVKPGCWYDIPEQVEPLVLRILEQSADPACNGVDPAQSSVGLGDNVSET